MSRSIASAPRGRRVVACLFAAAVAASCAITGIELTAEADGIDLSHYFTGKEGTDREQVFMCLKNGYYVRDELFRLNEDGKLYDIPLTSDMERKRLQKMLDEFRAIPQEYGDTSNGEAKKKKKDS